MRGGVEGICIDMRVKYYTMVSTEEGGRGGV